MHGKRKALVIIKLNKLLQMIGYYCTSVYTQYYKLMIDHKLKMKPSDEGLNHN